MMQTNPVLKKNIPSSLQSQIQRWHRRVILPERFAKRFRADIPDYYQQVTYAEQGALPAYSLREHPRARSRRAINLAEAVPIMMRDKARQPARPLISIEDGIAAPKFADEIEPAGKLVLAVLE